MMTGAYRHGRHGHCGYIDDEGWVKVSDSAWLFYVSEDWILRAADYGDYPFEVIQVYRFS